MPAHFCQSCEQLRRNQDDALHGVIQADFCDFCWEGAAERAATLSSVAGGVYA